MKSWGNGLRDDFEIVEQGGSWSLRLLPPRMFPVYVLCRRHGWTVFPVGTRAAPRCEICRAEMSDQVAMFTSKRTVRLFEREFLRRKDSP